MSGSRFRVLITARSFGKTSSAPAELLEQNGCQLIRRPGPFKEQELADLTHDIDGMIVGADQVSAAVIERANRLKVICQHGVGVDDIDLSAARKKGIVVANIPGGNADAVADLTWALMLCLARDVIRADRAVREGEFPVFVGRSVYGKTLGIIGLGNVGKAVACRARGFEMPVLAYDAVHDEEYARQWNIEYASLDTVLSNSDFVTVHLPLIDDTRGLISADKLRLMKPGSYLVNMSRGGIVDEAALVHLVQSNRLAGAATDVFAQEPPALDNPLLRLPGVITTPHMGGRTVESLGTISLRAAKAVLNVLNGSLEDVNVVNA
ncbi:MAG: phosphoglycerate dehydrogenase [Firmicutes bacterium]|nr:phosphoglycerate dehydrogenase [Bacillota bacterium]MDD4336142.1 phosphoglycerate dehydrogenase [Bacillota bacterium]MDD4792245.1 phosphoglycerate dehydrogenase [Bacillota bacterium]